MAIQHPQPPQVSGAVYPFLDVKLAMSTRPLGNEVTVDVSVTLTPYRQLEDGIELLEEGRKVFVWGDALNQAATDPHLARFLMTIQAAGQQFVNEAF